MQAEHAERATLEMALLGGIVTHLGIMLGRGGGFASGSRTKCGSERILLQLPKIAEGLEGLGAGVILHLAITDFGTVSAPSRISCALDDAKHIIHMQSIAYP